MATMNKTLPSQPHRRAMTQLWLGLAPLLVVAFALLAILAAQLPDARAPLSDATAGTVARVVESERPPDRRGLLVTFEDADGKRRTAQLILAEPTEVRPGTTVPVRYDPSSYGVSSVVYANGDAATRQLQGLISSMVVVGAALLLAAASTALVVVTRRRLRQLPVVHVLATRLVVQRGLLVRSCLELETASGVRWLPVFWAPELAVLAPSSKIEVHGRPEPGRLLLPVIAGAEVWPSGRVRGRTPRGAQRVLWPTTVPRSHGMLRQLRVDVLPSLSAPLLGLVWAYVDGSGLAGFLGGSAFSAVGLFWLFQRLGSDPEAPANR
ncbi:DUF3592 domain-containing protein [Blastococcus sp. KM273128]|uniref:DUF3592 domain-containing protein n=1 Tax=Blastococcus sp. KM273128 TaxID=2570314 RepID=UPI0035ABECBF